jgi:hypothetical protein
MTILGSSIRERFACWTSSKVPSSVTAMMHYLASIIFPAGGVLVVEHGRIEYGGNQLLHCR